MLKNKTIYIILISIILIFTLNTITYAEQITVVEQIPLAILDNPGEWEPTIQVSPTMQQKGATLAGVVQAVGASVAVIMLVVMGIKYMIGSAQEQAQYKKTMIPYLIGAVMIFAISTFLNILLSLVEGIF